MKIPQTENKKKQTKKLIDIDENLKSSNVEGGRKQVNYTINKLFANEVVGLRALRGNLTSFITKAVDNFQEILAGNTAVKGGKTVSIISTELLDNMLEAYKFNTIINRDQETGLYEIIVEEIEAAACAETKEEAIDILIDNILALTEDYFEDIELYIRIENTKKMLPYYMRIKHCKEKAELMVVLGLEI